MVAFTYINRRLKFKDGSVSEDQALKLSSCLVVLAEPGAGKTELLSSFAEKLDSPRIRASVFRHKKNLPQQEIIILDGLDEVAKLDSSAIETIFSLVAEAKPRLVIFASRSGEWDENRNAGLIKDFLGLEPTTVRLDPFDEAEQKLLFESYVPNENFSDFLVQTNAVDLSVLLGNPQFLQLFADAYVQNDRKFESKAQVFADAIRSMGKENNSENPTENRPSSEVIESYAKEIFAKLLFSGVAGVASRESLGDQSFPFLFSLTVIEQSKLKFLLDSRFFKPADSPSLHEPIHRIVAEYCAASYISKKVEDSKDPLSLRRCLSIIAPNGVVRNELRGLLGWLAALSKEETQICCINLDPYAVLANGDPSQLTTTAKSRLLIKLSDLAKSDPYFRRADIWRRFSVKGFFTPDLIADVRTMLSTGDYDNHLPLLLLELIQGSSVIKDLEGALKAIVLDEKEELHTRKMANKNLLSLPSYDHVETLTKLVMLGSLNALILTSEIVVEIRADVIGRENILRLLHAISKLYPTKQNIERRSSSSRYLISQIYGSFALEDVKWFLDKLSHNLKCTCEKDDGYDCFCRNGISKVISRLLDQYFKLETGHYDPVQVWGWLKPLHFEGSGSPERNLSVAILQSNDELRQAMHIFAFGDKTDRDEIWKIRGSFLWGACHSGMIIQAQDYKTYLEYAFEKNNVELWRAFFPSHHKNEKASNPLRVLARQHALLQPEFMRAWAQQKKADKEFENKHLNRRYRPSRNRTKNKKKARKAELDYFNANRTLIEAGQHWGWLKVFAINYLDNPEENLERVGELCLPENALLNAFSLLSKDLPTLNHLASLTNSTPYQVLMLHASCLAVFRKIGNLDAVDVDILRIVKTDADMGYSAVSEDEKTAFENELNRHVFKRLSDVELYAQEYIEPQLAIEGEHHTNVGWLQYKPEFSPLRERTPLEWLQRYPEMPLTAVDTLFELAAQYGDRTKLLLLIHKSCRELHDNWPTGLPSQKQNNQRDFWYLRAFVFCDEIEKFIWDDIRYYPDALLGLASATDQKGFGSHSFWPNLSACKIYMILDSFIGVWDKVDLPSSWGTGDPPEQTAYRFLSSLIWKIAADEPDKASEVLDKVLSDFRFTDFHNAALHLKSETARKLALRNFKAPNPKEVSAYFDYNRVSSVEDLRALMVEQLEDMQIWLNGAETDPLDSFYEHGKRVDENTARNRIVDYLNHRLNPLNISITIEKHMADSNRCDFTAETSIEGRQNLLTVEVKGQWHKALYSAAAEQLYTRYSHHPNAALQGIYLVLWFGKEEKVANKKNVDIKTPAELKQKIISHMPEELHNCIDVVVLDLSRIQK